MKLLRGLVGLLSGLGFCEQVQQPLELNGIESAAAAARKLVSESSLATLVTISADDVPEGQMEYYADCSTDGTELTLIGMHISRAYRNIAHGSKASMAIRVGDQPLSEEVNTSYPGAVPSPAGLPRITLYGIMLLEQPEPSKEVQECFLQRHPDAKWWIPGDGPVHDSYWAVFNVSSIHMIGGFGDRAFIGQIPLDVYKAAT